MPLKKSDCEGTVNTVSGGCGVVPMTGPVTGGCDGGFSSILPKYSAPFSVTVHRFCSSSTFSARPPFHNSARDLPTSIGFSPMALPISVGLVGSVICDRTCRIFNVLSFISATLFLLYL